VRTFSTCRVKLWLVSIESSTAWKRVLMSRSERDSTRAEALPIDSELGFVLSSLIRL
jgi:hypothetical protein